MCKRPRSAIVMFRCALIAACFRQISSLSSSQFHISTRRLLAHGASRKGLFVASAVMIDWINVVLPLPPAPAKNVGVGDSQSWIHQRRNGGSPCNVFQSIGASGGGLFPAVALP